MRAIIGRDSARAIIETAGALAFLLAVAACSGSSGSPAPIAPTPDPEPTPDPVPLAVLSIEAKANGPVNNLGLDPDSTFEIVFSEPVDSLSAQQLVVRDLGGPLRGAANSVDGIRWQWQPANDLPRGNTLEVRVVAGLTASSGNVLAEDQAAAFIVRPSQPATQSQVIELPVSHPAGAEIGALAWPGGRTVAVVDGRAYEVTATGATPLAESLHADTWTYGDDAYAFFRGERCARGVLGGAVESVALPGQVTQSATNWSGDIAIYVAEGTGPAASWGVWVLRATASSWQWLGSVAAPRDAVLSLPGNGNPMLCFANPVSHVPTLVRFAEGSAPTVHTAVPGSESVTMVRAVADADDSWQLLWVESDVETMTVRAIRQQAEQEVSAPVDLVTFGPNGTPYVQSIRTSARGSAVVHGGVSFTSTLFNCVGYTNLTSRIMRVEADGSTGPLEFMPIAGGANILDGVSPERGEWRCLQYTICSTSIRQNTARPGEAMVSDPTFQIGMFEFTDATWAANDSGQALVVTRPWFGPLLAVRID